MKFELDDYVLITHNGLEFYGSLIRQGPARFWNIRDAEDGNILFVHESNLDLVFRPSPTDAGCAEYYEIMGYNEIMGPENMD